MRGLALLALVLCCGCEALWGGFRAPHVADLSAVAGEDGGDSGAAAGRAASALTAPTPVVTTRGESPLSVQRTDPKLEVPRYVSALDVHLAPGWVHQEHTADDVAQATWLAAAEARVLGCLIEKEATTPDVYPLTIAAALGAANQKTARDPVINATESEVQVAVDALRALNLVFESSGSRVARHEHNMGRAMALPSQSVALLAVLMLRGPQTSSELRANCDRLHRFADVSSVEAFLDELAERPEDKGGPLALKLPRAPGAREARWTHLLCGPVDVSAMPVAAHNAAACYEREREPDQAIALLERLPRDQPHSSLIPRALQRLAQLHLAVARSADATCAYPVTALRTAGARIAPRKVQRILLCR